MDTYVYTYVLRVRRRNLAGLAALLCCCPSKFLHYTIIITALYHVNTILSLITNMQRLTESYLPPASANVIVMEIDRNVTVMIK